MGEDAHLPTKDRLLLNFYKGEGVFYLIKF